MKVLITGSNGFVAKNLKLHLKQRSDIQIFNFSKENKISELPELISKVDFIFHLAGVNRSNCSADFIKGNEKLTQEICKTIKKSKKEIKVLYSSSIQASLDNKYGVSKRNTENILLTLNKENKIPIYIIRLPNIFGKWSRPNYNSVVATFCYNIIRDIPIKIHNPKESIELIYIDDVIKYFITIMDNNDDVFQLKKDYLKNKSYKITVGDLAKQLYEYKKMKTTKILQNVGTGFSRALYATFISYLPPEHFSYTVDSIVDSRGSFIEMLKTNSSGQFSCLSILPGKIRGNHYHNSKTEKFLLVKGQVKMKFLQVNTMEKYEIIIESNKPQIVETIPGWAHSIENIGKEEAIVMIWANEIFDKSNPDTFAYQV